MSTRLAHTHPLAIAFALSLGAAISLGMSRFSYALLLPPMRADLGWSYLLAGAMNTANALGYLIGALATPALLRRYGGQKLLIGGALMTALFLLLSGLVTDAGILLLQRLLAGIASALIFVAGGVLAARLGSLHPPRAGLLIGVYYGGTGLGIVLSALLVPATDALAHGTAHAWQWAWLALGATCLLGTAVMAWPIQSIDGKAPPASAQDHFDWHPFRFGLGGYFLFGVGYIGYMTFVVALLREQGMSAGLITLFYSGLGLAVFASSRIWARLLDRCHGGEAMALLNGLLAVATLVPALTAQPVLVFASGLLFGGVFLSVVASSTALVRHNLPSAAWSGGIGAFTSAFAFGQIVGPGFVGWIADGPGGLQRGLLYSALALLAGAALASRQRKLAA
ncbi:YbfB/YjiJ family MFS transporter [Actimicrobium antarcticum]|uniref:YbfB/YjiJ family MFS transporter n=1 Tax=Actimicrobium antarcticum TaxID=1051899 RepID=A0ABP7T764_9BURK